MKVISAVGDGLQTLLQYLVVLAIGIVIIGISVFLIALSLGTDLRDHVSTVRCMVYDGEACVDQRLAEQRALLAEAQRQLTASQRQLEGLGRIFRKFDTVNLFKHTPVGDLKITSGARYLDALTAPRWSNAWCYTKLEVDGLEISIDLASRNPGESIVLATLTDAEREKLGSRDIEALRAACVWPAPNPST